MVIGHGTVSSWVKLPNFRRKNVQRRQVVAGGRRSFSWLTQLQTVKLMREMSHILGWVAFMKSCQQPISCQPPCAPYGTRWGEGKKEITSSCRKISHVRCFITMDRHMKRLKNSWEMSSASTKYKIRSQTLWVCYRWSTQLLLSVD